MVRIKGEKNLTVETIKITDRDFDLWWLLRQAKEAIEKARVKELANYNLSRRSSSIVFLIHALGDSVSISRITRYYIQRDHSIREHLIRMAKKGLIEIYNDNNQDGGRLRVKLTEKGKSAYIYTTYRESIHNILSSLSEERRKQLTVCLEILRDSALRELGDRKYDTALPSQLEE